MSTTNYRGYRFFLLFVVALILGACGGSGSSAGVPPSENLPPSEPAEPLPDSQTDHAFSTDHFSGSENCAFCHDGLQDAAGTDVSIVADWQASMMANSSRDPFWRAKVASEVRRNPGLQEEIESTCARCHVPMAHVEASFALADLALLEDGLLHPDNALFDAAADGVSCTLCHQVADSVALGTADGFSGQFEIPYNFGADRTLYGQYADPLANPMINRVGFTPAGSEHISSSRVCASCHNLFTPVVDDAGNITDEEFPEQTVYTEWENSDFADAQSCVDCHMPGASGTVRITTRPMNGVAARPDFSRHLVAGGNTYMLDLIDRNSDALNVTASGFEVLADATRTLLGSAADLDIEEMTRYGTDLGFTVRVTNNSGHKLPTSYPSRRVWLHVVATDAGGTVVFESGAIDESGRIVGLDSDFDFASEEPHHRTISSGTQVQSYETIMQNREGDVTYTLIEAATYRKDNRLLPLGMDKTTAPATIKPLGDAADDADFVAGSDLVHFRIPELAAGIYDIQVSLNYQALAYGHAQDLFLDIDDPRVALFQALNENALTRFETIASVSRSINF